MRRAADDEFDELCFAFGIELDEVTSERKQAERERSLTAEAAQAYSDEVLYRIEIPANRYDLLCLEGLSRALRVFLEVDASPRYSVTRPEHPQTMFVASETAAVRSFVVCAVLRGVTFTPARYASFIELQEKLHQNICRKRTLVAIGTHDLDTLQGPFRYNAEPPGEIKFVPLNQTVEVDGPGLMQLYESDRHLRPFLSIIRDAPCYPVIRDSNGVVLSLPPIINSNHSKITLATTNVFIECTATDHTKANVVLNQMVAMFAEYCARPFSVEQVRVVYPDDRLPERVNFYPVLDDAVFTTSVRDINTRVGIAEPAAAVVRLLSKMMLRGELQPDGDTIVVSVPPTRADILHACDITEDVAIAYGFNAIVKTLPRAATVGRQLPINKLTDLLRYEMAMAGFMEVLTFALCSHADAFENLRRPDDGSTAVVIGNPKSEEFQLARPSLMGGLLKTLAHARTHELPLRIFEVSDVVLKDPRSDVGASNVRRLGAAFINSTSAGFEIVHGVLDRVMDVCGMRYTPGTRMPAAGCYAIVESVDPAFLTGRQAEVFFSGRRIGILGVVHPEALAAFGLSKPASVIELDVQPLLERLPEQ